MDAELEFCETKDNGQLEVIDIGDVASETKQQFPGGPFFDCVWASGTRFGC